MKKTHLFIVVLLALLPTVSFAQDAYLQWRVGDDSAAVGNHEGSLWLPNGIGGETPYQRKWNNVAIDSEWNSGEVPVVFIVDVVEGSVYVEIDGWSEDGFFGFNENIEAIQLDVAADATPRSSLSGLTITSFTWSGDGSENVEVEGMTASGGPETCNWLTDTIYNPEPLLYTRVEVRGKLRITSENSEDCPSEDALWGGIGLILE